MQLLVQNCLDPSCATEIFSVPKRRIFAIPKIVRYPYRNKRGLQNLHFGQVTLGCWVVRPAVGSAVSTGCVRVLSPSVSFSCCEGVRNCLQNEFGLNGLNGLNGLVRGQLKHVHVHVISIVPKNKGLRNLDRNVNRSRGWPPVHLPGLLFRLTGQEALMSLLLGDDHVEENKELTLIINTAETGEMIVVEVFVWKDLAALPVSWIAGASSDTMKRTATFRKQKEKDINVKKRYNMCVFVLHKNHIYMRT